MGNRKIPHTRVAKGKRVRVVLRDEEVIIGKFIESNDRSILVEGHPRVTKDLVRAFGIYKGK